MQHLCAEQLTTLPTQIIQQPLVLPPVANSSQARQPQAVPEQPDAKQQLQKVSILQARRLELTPELQALQKQVRHLLQQPTDLSTLEQLAQQPAQFEAYMERQFYMNNAGSEIRALIELFALALGEKAIPPLLAWGKQFADRKDMVQSIIIAMDNLPEDTRLRAFVNQQLENERQYPEIIRSALMFHAMRPDDSSKRWAIQFRSPGVSHELRYLGVYLSAQIFDDQQLFPWIMELLQQQPPQYQRYYLHLALARVMGDAHYQQLAQRLPLAAAVKASVQRQRQFLQADDAHRLSLVSAMLASGFYEERQQALAYLIATRNKQQLSALLQGPMAAQVYRKAQYAGIDLGSVPPQITASSPTTGAAPATDLRRYLLLAVLLVVMVVTVVTVTMLRFKRRGSGHVSAA